MSGSGAAAWMPISTPSSAPTSITSPTNISAAASTLPQPRHAALREFGGVAQAREAVRDRRGFRPVDTLMHDMRYALRLLRKAPGFTAAAVLTLALGIGANAAIFSLVDAVVFRPLPYADPDRLVAVWELIPASPGQPPTQRIVAAPANLADFSRARSAAVVGGYLQTTRNLTGEGTPERLVGEEVTPEYFSALGIAPALGRPIVSGDDRPGRQHVVVVSDAFWRERFGALDTAIGAQVTLDSERYEVVGVMPPEFRGISHLGGGAPVTFWVPAVFPPEVMNNRLDHEIALVARLAPEATAPALRDELRAIAASLAIGGAARSIDLAPLADDVSSEARPLMLLLLGAVGLVLLLACVNVAGLLIVRALARRRELEVRLALGATRLRVAGELLTQSAVLVACGAIAGLACAYGLTRWLVSMTPPTIPRLDAVAIDGRVLLFTFGISALTAAAFSLVPILQVGRTSRVAARSGRGVTSAWANRSRTALMVIEITLSTVLLVGAALMIRSLVTLNNVPLGFDPAGVLTANVRLPAARYADPGARLRFFEAVEERIAALPGVTSVSFANRLPLRGGWTSGMIIEAPDGSLPATPSEAGFQSVSPGYFQTFGLRAVQGRVLRASDREGAPAVALVNEEFVRRFIGPANPIGRRLRRGPKQPSIEVVGVVGNIRRGGRLVPVVPEVYLAAAQTSLYPLWLEQIAVRFANGSESRIDDLRAAIWSVDRDSAGRLPPNARSSARPATG